MTVSPKRKRSIIVDGREYLWWVAEQDRYPYEVLLKVVTTEGGAYAVFRVPLKADAEVFPNGPPEQVTPAAVEALIRLRPTGDQEDLRFTTVALDLEGTLISNAMSQFPRAGLFQFLERCHSHIPRVVIFTAVAERAFRRIAIALAREQLVPDWFADIEYVDWSGPYKDLDFIKSCDSSRALLVDDNPDYVAPAQQDQWVRVPEFAPPYEEDTVLDRIWDAIKTKNGKAYEWA